ncbi:RNA polymerase sigma factor [Anaerobacillus isosaccharinicus]|uniref:RNA polymerase sigma factor n=1 Tax=Anaerobacillus isosaccharinicus TaxID=1532552 RepID=A0A1S2L5B1_9BACI|nr:RNA polymerase sigma factor [Anaerobacillus isosaccharinicus]MBA5588733.1 RNA polymerase sigma factor [Anaerobacillus isosaccharinicus]QOY37867.1 RNA polymerase sigma factor [Anaerobacillus isosaccharinicus]
MSDQEIIKQIQSGNDSAFRGLYDLYYDYAIRTATIVMNHNASYAADAVQETFIRVYQNIHLYQSDRPFKPWFYKILLNECNRILKQNSKVVSVGEIIERSQIDPKLEDYEDLYEAIQGLESHNRTPIVLKYLNGFKEQEIADILEENVNTIKSRLFKGRQKLKTFLEAKEEAN